MPQYEGFPTRHAWAFDLLGETYQCIPHINISDPGICEGCGVLVTDEDLGARFRAQLPIIGDHKELAPWMVVVFLNHVAEVRAHHG